MSRAYRCEVYPIECPICGCYPWTDLPRGTVAVCALCAPVVGVEPETVTGRNAWPLGVMGDAGRRVTVLADRRSTGTAA
jgi:hypothetical protein